MLGLIAPSACEEENRLCSWFFSSLVRLVFRLTYFLWFMVQQKASFDISRSSFFPASFLKICSNFVQFRLSFQLEFQYHVLFPPYQLLILFLHLIFTSFRRNMHLVLLELRFLAFCLLMFQRFPCTLIRFLLSIWKALDFNALTTTFSFWNNALLISYFIETFVRSNILVSLFFLFRRSPFWSTVTHWSFPALLLILGYICSLSLSLIFFRHPHSTSRFVVFSSFYIPFFLSVWHVMDCVAVNGSICRTDPVGDMISEENPFRFNLIFSLKDEHSPPSVFPALLDFFYVSSIYAPSKQEITPWREILSIDDIPLSLEVSDADSLASQFDCSFLTNSSCWFGLWFSCIETVFQFVFPSLSLSSYTFLKNIDGEVMKCDFSNSLLFFSLNMFIFACVRVLSFVDLARSVHDIRSLEHSVVSQISSNDAAIQLDRPSGSFIDFLSETVAYPNGTRKFSKHSVACFVIRYFRTNNLPRRVNLYTGTDFSVFPFPLLMISENQAGIRNLYRQKQKQKFRACLSCCYCFVSLTLSSQRYLCSFSSLVAFFFSLFSFLPGSIWISNLFSCVYPQILLSVFVFFSSVIVILFSLLSYFPPLLN